jgi:hypothetical protein
MEILSAYIRENARYDPQNAPYRSDGSYDQEAHYRVLAADIEAILTVLRRRQRRYEKSNQRLNLHWGRPTWREAGGRAPTARGLK